MTPRGQDHPETTQAVESAPKLVKATPNLFEMALHWSWQPNSLPEPIQVWLSPLQT